VEVEQRALPLMTAAGALQRARLQPPPLMRRSGLGVAGTRGEEPSPLQAAAAAAAAVIAGFGLQVSYFGLQQVVRGQAWGDQMEGALSPELEVGQRKYFGSPVTGVLGQMVAFAAEMGLVEEAWSVVVGAAAAAAGNAAAAVDTAGDAVVAWPGRIEVVRLQAQIALGLEEPWAKLLAVCQN